MLLLRFRYALAIAFIAALPAMAADIAVAIPRDPNELVTTVPQAVAATGPERVAMANKLRQSVPASRFSGVYVVTINFTAEDVQHNPVSGDLEETSIPSGTKHWTAHLGNLSLERLIFSDQDYDKGLVDPIPLRIFMARRMVFSTNPGGVPKFLRVAEVEQNGLPLTCILGSHDEVTTEGRDWSETEHCIDGQGLLRIYSEVPGQYAVYHYDAGNKYQDRLMPNGVTVYQGGRAVMEEKVKVRMPGTVDLALFRPGSEMHAPGTEMDGVIHRVVAPRAGEAASNAPVIVHGALTAEGQVVEIEALRESDASAAAVERVRKLKFRAGLINGAPQPREFFALVQ